MVMESLSVDSERRQVWTCKMVLHLLLMVVIVLKAMRLHWLKIKVVLKVVRPRHIGLRSKFSFLASKGMAFQLLLTLTFLILKQS